MVELATTTWGDGSRRALLIHGLSSSAAGWWRLGPDLAGLGYCVVAPDLRGHGDSPPGRDYRLESYTADVLGLGTGWDVVLGHSLGGAIAILAQDQEPSFAGELVLEDPALEFRRDINLDWLLDPWSKSIDRETVAADHPTWAEGDVTAKVEALLHVTPEVVAATVVDNPGSLIPQLHRLEVPTRLVAADPTMDPLVTEAQGKAAVAANPHIEFTVIPGAGHSIHREQYELFWKAAFGDR